MSAHASTGGGVKGWHVLAAMLTFFIAVIAVNVGFIVAAVGSFPGEDAPRSYLQGLHYNQTLAERRAQRALGWSANAVLQQQGGGAQLVVLLRTRDGAPLDGLTVSGELERHTRADLDRALAFEPAGEGRYVAQAPALAAGQWRLRARADNGRGEALDFESELIWASP